MFGWNRRMVCKKGISVALVLCLGVGTGISAYSAEETIDYDALLSAVRISESYETYLKNHADAKIVDAQVVIDGKDFTADSVGCEIWDESKGAYTDEESHVSYTFDVEKTGLYCIKLNYYPVAGKNNDIGRSLFINGEQPFEEASYFELKRIWENETEIMRDARGNDVRPSQQEAPDWIEIYLSDSDGFYTEPFYFYFANGKNTITLEAVKEPLVIGSITLCDYEPPMDYETYLSMHEGTGDASTSAIKIQGEDARYKSNSVLYPIYDRSSPRTEPQDAAKIRLNTIGGANWDKNGQWIEWEIEVPEDALYEIAVKYRQNKNQGVTVSRSLYIDGKLPFAEARELAFYYDNDWQIETLGDKETKEAYRFYLTAGTHTLRLAVTLEEELSDILRRVDESVGELNTAYRKLLMIIGTSPDTMRDYQLDQKAPDALAILARQQQVMAQLETDVKTYAKGSKGSQTATIQNLTNQLSLMVENPRRIAKQWSAFKDNIVALSSWQLTMESQPLEIDYLLLHIPGESLPRAKAYFWEAIEHEWNQFVASFTEDYDSIGDVYEDGEALEVWILADSSVINSQSGSGRDQATVIKDLVDNYFVPKTGIPVNVKLVNKDVLLSATLAGKGPDVALNVAGKEPVNYALRHAAVDLSRYEDFDEVAEWFYKDALTQFTYDGGVYALPQTMSFHVMFYRADILNDLGLSIPRTWDEFYECLSVIQKNNMNVGIVPDYTTFAMYLYQYGGEYYTADQMASALDSEEAIAAFKTWSRNYSEYDMPITFDFANRFRTGEMPLSIGDYTNYNYLSVFAPEIKGLWGFTVVPGYEREDGSLDHTVSAWESASIIMATSDKPDAGWEFLKWWMSAETQTDYGNEIENVLGIAGRVATANLEALANIPWSAADYRQLAAQLEWVKAIPELPGSYYLERNIKNAFYTVYDDYEDPREVLQDACIIMNDEITSKRREFHLETR